MPLPLLKRILLGAVIGFIAAALLGFGVDLVSGQPNSPVTIDTLGGYLGLLIIGLLIGGFFAIQFTPTPDSDIENLMAGALIGLISWLILAVSLFPVLAGQVPFWQAETIVTRLPHLIVYTLVGGLVGFIYSWFYQTYAEQLQLNPAPKSTGRGKQVLIVGGGYAGVSAAQALEKALARKPDVRICLVSQTNYLLHTPMLSEVSSSAVDAQHIAPSLRSFFRRVQVVQGQAERVDLQARKLFLAADAHTPTREMVFDHLILAVGGVPNFFGNEAVEAAALTFKSLEDAVYLRNRLINMFERVDANFAEQTEVNVEQQQRLLTFAVAGGGFAGVELIGGLNDFARGMLPYYPNIPLDCLRVVLVHSRSIILPELSESLGQYALEKLAERGVEFKLNIRVMGAEAGQILLGDGKTVTESLPTETFVWTAGNRPHPLMDNLGLPLNQRGQLEVTPELHALEAEGVWAVGDCAQVPDLVTGKTCPPTAQYSLRQGKVVGYNVAAALQGKPLKQFKYKTQGSLAALGHQLAVAEISGYRFSGFLAWLMWRFIYLSKLPTLQKQVRVGLDWLLDVFFPPDIVQTIDVRQTELSQEQGS